MRTADGLDDGAPAGASGDLTARARLRDAAVGRFAADGFGATVRAIAADAGVSPGLVLHHFGSKDGLRRACDEHVLETIRSLKNDNISRVASGGGMLAALAVADERAPIVGYVLRSMQDGSALGREFLEHMVDDAVGYSRAAVEAGLVVPSRDEQARARYLTLSALGALLLEVTLDPPADPHDTVALVRRFLAASYLPMLELFTNGYFTTRRMLDEYLLYVSDPPTDAAPAPAHP